MDTPASTKTPTDPKASAETKTGGFDLAGDSKDGVAYIAVEIILSEIVDKVIKPLFSLK
jgi:hypothetical protein